MVSTSDRYGLLLPLYHRIWHIYVTRNLGSGLFFRNLVFITFSYRFGATFLSPHCLPSLSLESITKRERKQQTDSLKKMVSYVLVKICKLYLCIYLINLGLMKVHWGKTAPSGTSTSASFNEIIFGSEVLPPENHPEPSWLGNVGHIPGPKTQGVRLSADHLDHPPITDAPSIQTPQKCKSLPLALSPDIAHKAFLLFWVAELDRNFSLAQCHWQVWEKGKLRHKFHC